MRETIRQTYSMKLKRLLAFGASVLVIAAAGPDDAQTIFGLELGKPLSIPPCPRKVLPGGIVSQYTFESADPAETCYEPDIQLSDAPWRRGSFAFPIKRVPLIMRGNTGFTLIIDGKLEGVQIDTLGSGNADGIIRELSAKYGKPQSISRTKSTVSGISLPSIEAKWQIQGVFIRYLSIDYSVESGSLWIQSTKMHALREQWHRQQSLERTPL